MYLHMGERSGRGSGRVGSHILSAIAGRVGSGQRFAGSGRVGSEKSDPWTTLAEHTANTYMPRDDLNVYQQFMLYSAPINRNPSAPS